MNAILTYDLYKNSASKDIYNRETKFVELLSKRSYLRYLFNHPNKHQFEHFIDLESLIEKRINSIDSYNTYSSNFLKSYDPLIKIDSEFKNVDNSIRIKLALSKNDISSFNSWNPELNRQQQLYEATNGYKIMDVWYLKLKISKNEKILFEDIVLSNGKNGNELNMHEDDFLYFSEAIGSMFKRWENFN